MHALAPHRVLECSESYYMTQSIGTGESLSDNRFQGNRTDSDWQERSCGCRRERRSLIRPQIVAERRCERAFDRGAHGEMRVVGLNRDFARGRQLSKPIGVRAK